MKTAENPVIYVTKDRERAEGIPESDEYFIMSGNGQEDTFDLLSDPENQKIISKRKASVLVFKNNARIEALAHEKGWKLLNPSAELAEKVENKITQVAWLSELASLLPKHEIILTKNISWKKEPLILQWAHSHTGDGTFFISKESELKDLQRKFPDREARVTSYVNGPMFTANIVVAKDKILVGNISYQITGIKPFTDNPLSTIGNDWSLTHSILTEAQIAEFYSIAEKIGTKLRSDGWKGLFGIDVIYDIETDRLCLIEINARQPASTTYESQLQTLLRSHGVPGITTFEAHLKALLDEPITGPLVEINDGAQIIQRVTSTSKKIDVDALKTAGYKVTEYTNTKINSDLLRIQSERGIMETHGKFNKRGKEIEDIIKK